jgi:hypothetical protein
VEQGVVDSFSPIICHRVRRMETLRPTPTFDHLYRLWVHYSSKVHKKAEDESEPRVELHCVKHMRRTMPPGPER